MPSLVFIAYKRHAPEDVVVFYKFCGSISTGTIIICQVGNLNGLRAKFVGFCYMST